MTEILGTPEALFARAEQLAAHLATLPQKALEGTKKVLNAVLPHAESLSQAVDWNAERIDGRGVGHSASREVERVRSNHPHSTIQRSFMTQPSPASSTFRPVCWPVSTP